MWLLETLVLAAWWLWVGACGLLIASTFVRKSPFSPLARSAGASLGQRVTFRSTDGLSLAGLQLIADPSRPWLLLCHDLQSNRDQLLALAGKLHKAGYNILLFDARAHGESDGLCTTYGWREQRDLEGALAFLGRQEGFSDRFYGIYGVGLGAIMARLVAQRDDRLGAIAVTDLPKDFTAYLTDQLSRRIGVSLRLFHGLVDLAFRTRFGVSSTTISRQLQGTTNQMRILPLAFAAISATDSDQVSAQLLAFFDRQLKP